MDGSPTIEIKVSCLLAGMAAFSAPHTKCVNVDDIRYAGVSPDHLKVFRNSLWRKPRLD